MSWLFSRALVAARGGDAVKAITVCQPYAELLLRKGPTGELVKPYENRTWPTGYRGRLLIHAGKSRDWLDCEPPIEGLVFGAIIGMVVLRDCVHIDTVSEDVLDHPHAEGPWLWVVESPMRCKPFPFKGALGLWNVHVDVLAQLEFEEVAT